MSSVIQDTGSYHLAIASACPTVSAMGQKVQVGVHRILWQLCIRQWISGEQFLGSSFRWFSSCFALGQNISWERNSGLKAAYAGSLERKPKPGIEAGRNSLIPVRPAHPGGLGRWSRSPRSWARTNPCSPILSWSPALITAQDWMKSSAMNRLGLQVQRGMSCWRIVHMDLWDAYTMLWSLLLLSPAVNYNC